MTETTVGTQEAPEPSRPTGIFALPVAGRVLTQARDLTEGLRPTEEDTTAQVVAKRVAQGAVITGTAAVTAVVIL